MSKKFMRSSTKTKEGNRAVGLDLTEGSIWRKLLLFSLPLLGSSFILQLYNTVDFIFVGNFIGTEAAAAVGASTLLVNCLINLFTGISIGAGVVAAWAFGAKDTKKLHRTIQTAAAITLYGSLGLTTLGILLAPFFLRLLNTPEEIFPLAVLYIRIFFLGILSIVGYNMAAGILRAMGNARSPMVYQFIGGICNVIANYLFIVVFQWGVVGSAMATLLSQSLAFILTAHKLTILPPEYALYWHRIKLYPEEGKRMLAVGLPAGIQAMVITLSNLMVQSNINLLGVSSMAAFSAYFKVESVQYLPILSIGFATTSFVSQNLGAGKIDRIRKGVRICLLMGMVITVSLCSFLLFFSYEAFRIFVKDGNVIAIGQSIIAVTFPPYFLYVFLEVLSNAVRGAGKSVPPMLIIVSFFCGVRIFALLWIMSLWQSAHALAYAYPISWAGAAIVMILYYTKANWLPIEKKHREQE